MGQSVDADRAYVFENETRDGQILSSQRYEWNSGSAEAQLDNPELQDLHMSNLLPHWLTAFDRGEAYFGNVRELLQADRDILEPQDILSILVCPIRVHSEVWGFVGFDDCSRERDWSGEQRQVLAHASTALAAALRHRQLSSRLSVARGALREVLGST